MQNLYVADGVIYGRVRGINPRTGKPETRRVSMRIREDEPNATARAEAKRVLMETLATRNAGKTQPSKTLAEAVEERREAMRVAGGSPVG